MIGNVKESLLPYIIEQFKLMKLSLDFHGAVTPNEEDTKDLTSDGSSQSKDDADPKKNEKLNKASRSISQTELECRKQKVRIPCC